MKLPQFVVNLLADRLIAKAKRTPYYHLKGYMNRFWLVPYVHAGSAQRPDDGTGPVRFSKRPIARMFQWLGVGVRIHEILRSDDANALHDHPWPYLSIILKGAYRELTPGPVDHSYEYGDYFAGDVLLRSAKSRHSLQLHGEGPVTTLFITGKWVQKWGFFVDGKKVDHNEFRGRSMS